MHDLKSEGKVRFIGLSQLSEVHGPSPHLSGLEHSPGDIAKGTYDAVQIPYSALLRQNTVEGGFPNFLAPANGGIFTCVSNVRHPERDQMQRKPGCLRIATYSAHLGGSRRISFRSETRWHMSTSREHPSSFFASHVPVD